MKTNIAFFKSHLVGNIVGLLLGCIAGILLSFPYYTALVLPFGLFNLPSLITMVTTGIIPQYSDYNTWPHWVPMFHLLAVSIYYTLALLGFGYCGFSAARRTGSAKSGIGAAFWAGVVSIIVSAVAMLIAIIVQQYTGFSFSSVGLLLLSITIGLLGLLMTSIALSLLMGIASCLVALFAGAIGVVIGSKRAKIVQIPLTN